MSTGPKSWAWSINLVLLLDLDTALSSVEKLFTRHGGRRALEQSDEEHLRHERQNWRLFASAVFIPLRSALLRLVEILPLHGDETAAGLLRLIKSLLSESTLSSDTLAVGDVPPSTLTREWHRQVQADVSDRRVFNRHQLEVVAILELASAIKAGEVFIVGLLSFDRF